MLGAKRAVWLCHTSDSQQRRAPEAGESNVQVISERVLIIVGAAPRRISAPQVHDRAIKL